MKYQVTFTPRARRDLRRLRGDIYECLQVAIRALALDLRPHGCLKLTGQEAWRIRIGDYRVVYEIEDDQLVVIVIRIAGRGDVYR